MRLANCSLRFTGCLLAFGVFVVTACGDDSDDGTPACPDGQVFSPEQDRCVPEGSVTDADMDGVVADDDCDDDDAMLGAISADADCDGVLTAMDCDDADAAIGSNADDMDCDGVATAMDCDDADPAVGSSADDMDCDGVATAMDCDDMDAMVGSNANDMDCDGVATAMDCDDTDDMLGAIADDTDCDGALNDDEECPNDSRFTDAPAPVVATRFPSQVSATTAAEITVSGFVTLFCDNTLASIEASLGVNMIAVDTEAVSNEEVAWSFDATLPADAVSIISIVATDSRTRAGTNSVSIERYGPPSVFLESSQGIAVDPTTNTAYVSDEALPGVYSINLATGTSTVFSATGFGAGPDFTSDLEGGIALDAPNGRLLVTDDGADSVIAVDLTTGDRTLVSGPNLGSGPSFGTIYGIAVDTAANRAFVADSGIDGDGGVDGVVEVDLATGNRTVLSTGAELDTPRDVDLDLANNRLLVVGTGADALTAVDLATGDRTILSATGVGMGLDFSSIRGVTLDAPNNRVFIAEAGNNFEGVVAVDLATGDRTKISGNLPDADPVGDTLDAGADFDSTRGIYVDAANDRLVVVDDQVTALVLVDLDTGDRSLVSPRPPVGTGPGLVDPLGLALDSEAGVLYVADDGQAAILSIQLETGERAVLADGTTGGTTLDAPRGLGLDLANNRLLVPDNGLDAIVGIDLTSGMGTSVSDDDSPDETSETFSSPRGAVTVDSGGMFGYVADTARDSVFRFDLATGERFTLAEAGDAELEGVQTVLLDEANNRAVVTVASTGDDDVLDGLLAIDLLTGERTTLASRSSDMPAVGTGLDMTNPRGLALDLANDRALILDSDLDALIAVDLTTLERTVISSEANGNGTFLTLENHNTNSIVLDAPNQVVYAANETGSQVILIDLTTGQQVVFTR
jgi:hypothetical protein